LLSLQMARLRSRSNDRRGAETVLFVDLSSRAKFGEPVRRND
jgi:hypothetical protein